MCGICGILNLKSKQPVERIVLERMNRAMEYRGPDDAGLYIEKDFGMASRRLAILDLSVQGHMPMVSPDGRYWIVYNGEVYNFAELRAELIAKGVIFRSHTDTEVLVNLYSFYGPEMLARCNGMFSIAIWDTLERQLFVARDRMGVKPLFYALQDGRFYFGSEEKVLFVAGVHAEFDESTWTELLCLRYVSGERTPYRAVKRLLPGHYLTVQDNQVETHQWWSLEKIAERSYRGLSPRQAAETLFDLLNRSMQLRRISDVPVGVLLSGGIDSGGMAALMAEQVGQGVKSFTVRFSKREYDEGSLARQVANRWGLEHHEMFVLPEHIPALLQEATHLLDEPIVHGNDLHILAISRFAKPLVTVLLSGEGADEIMGGYVRYRLFLYESLFRFFRRTARWLHGASQVRGRNRKALELLLCIPEERLVFSSAEVFPAEIKLAYDMGTELSYRLRVARQAQSVYQQGVRQVMFYEQHTYLQSVLDRNDRMTMGASIECREPYLDYELVEWLACLPKERLFENGVGKAVLRRALHNHLPSSVLQHKKWGFGVPWQEYFRQIPILRNYVEHLPAHTVFETLPGGREQLQFVVQRFLAGDNTLTPLVRQWFMIGLWYAQKIENQAEPLAPLTLTQRYMN